MADDKYITYKQGFISLVSGIALGVTLGAYMWGHEMDQNKRIERNSEAIKKVDETFKKVDETFKRMETMLKTQNDIATDTRERVIRIEERIKN